MATRPLASAGLAIVLVVATSITLAKVLGGPGTVPPLEAINQPLKNLDVSDLPDIAQYTGRDASALAYRHYPAQGSLAKGSVVLVHGSSASSQSMHVPPKAWPRMLST